MGWVFLGTHPLRLDDKGRLFLPVRFREELSGGVVVANGQERCLYVFSEHEFTVLAESLHTAPLTRKAARDFGRMLYASASAEVPDKSGRIPLTTGQREYAGLDRDCVVTGAYKRVEIWNPAAWDTYRADREQGYADVVEEVLPGLL